MLNAIRHCARRMMSTTAEATTSASAYPFSSVAIIPPAPAVPAPAAARQGKGLMQHLTQRLQTPEKLALLARFGRHHPERILPGSVLSVSLRYAPGSFTGVLLGVRRRGADTSFLLRNVVARTGVEAQFFVCSPHVKDVKVLMRAGGRGEGRAGKRMRRAKLFYLRDAPDKMTAISAGMGR